MEQQYSNELTPKILAGFDSSPFTTEQLASISDDARALIEEQKTFCRVQPATAVYRIAVDGSLTQRGGVVRPLYNGSEMELADGRKANIALEGDEVVYPDGSTARINTGGGKQFLKHEQGTALVGSRLSNGDLIISTPQSTGMLVAREGMPVGNDVLTAGA